MHDFNMFSDAELFAAKARSQDIVGGFHNMGKQAQARGNIRKINIILRERGLLVDAKAKLITKDQTGLIAAAVAPLKVGAQDHAEKLAAQVYAAMLKALHASQYNLEVVAPYPKATMGKAAYRAALARRSAFQRLFVTDAARRFDDRTTFLTVDVRKLAQYLKDEREAAGVSFDAYVAKLEGKVGQGVTAASIEGRQLWQGSTLIVAKGDTIERWHTQQIINCSVLGTLFNQWPTRKS